MQGFETIFDNRSFDKDKLIAFGFVKNKLVYTYSCPLLNGQFRANVVVCQDGKVVADVVDAESNEIYYLVKVENATGSFVGKLRTEFETILVEIADKCFYVDVFKSKVAKKVIDYIKNKYGDELEFLWPKFSKNAICRRKDNTKWYVAFLTLSKSKLGLDSDENVEIIDLRIDSSKIDVVVDGKKYFPGYHMNKKHWFTICLDGSVSSEDICDLIDASYVLAKK